MPRFILIPLLAFGTLAGFASGFHSLHAHRGCAWHDDWRREAAWRDPGPPPQLAPPPQGVVQPAAPAPTQTLVIPIIVGAPQGAAAPAPTAYLLPVGPSAPPPAPGK